MYKSGDYEIDNSLRLEDGDNAVLERYMAAAGNTKTWTLSMWVKRGRLSADTGYENIFTSPGNSYISFTGDNDDAIRIFSHDGSLRMQLVTKQEFRDPAAWYHLVFRCDTTQNTDTNRFRFYVNGSQVTEFESSANNYSKTYPPQNHDMHWNEVGRHYIGGGDGNDGDFYMSEVNFVDGTSLGADSFGETDDDYGHWKPKKYGGSYGTNGFYLNFKGSDRLMSATGGTITTDGDYKVHSFTSTGNTNFVVSSTTLDYAEADVLVVAGGGNGGYGGSSVGGGGGGAGGVIYQQGFGISAQTYTVTVGAAATDSVFSTLTAKAGGNAAFGAMGSPGGSGAGRVGNDDSNLAQGILGQGFAGGNGSGTVGVSVCAGGGGGGAGGVGGDAPGPSGGSGGAGRAISISGSSVTYGTGGAGAAHNAPAGGSSTANTGNGGAGWGGGQNGGGSAGGTGIVIIRYKFQ